MPRCPQRQGRDYSKFLVKNRGKASVSYRGRRFSCNQVFTRLDSHLRVSARCKQASSVDAAQPRVSANSSQAAASMNCLETASQLSSSNEPNPSTAASVILTNEIAKNTQTPELQSSLHLVKCLSVLMTGFLTTVF